MDELDEIRAQHQAVLEEIVTPLSNVGAFSDVDDINSAVGAILAFEDISAQSASTVSNLSAEAFIQNYRQEFTTVMGAVSKVGSTIIPQFTEAINGGVPFARLSGSLNAIITGVLQIIDKVECHPAYPYVCKADYGFLLESTVNKQKANYRSLRSTFASVSAAQATSSSSGGCYVATCVYGSYDCPEVWTLRRFRDYDLAETRAGRAFIKAYYAVSPTLVKWFGETEWFKRMWRGSLDRMVTKCQAKGFASTPYEDRRW